MRKKEKKGKKKRCCLRVQVSVGGWLGVLLPKSEMRKYIEHVQGFSPFAPSVRISKRPSIHLFTAPLSVFQHALVYPKPYLPKVCWINFAECQAHNTHMLWVPPKRLATVWGYPFGSIHRTFRRPIWLMMLFVFTFLSGTERGKKESHPLEIHHK